jgi:protein-disulfide isomerase
MPFSRRVILASTAAIAIAGCSKDAGAGPAAGDMSLGDPNAPVKLVEYASLTCSHCARFNAEVFPELKKKYIDTGKVHYTLREFLTPPQELAAAGFLLARCAGEDKYFQVVDAVFRSQGEWASTGDVRGSLLRIAQSVGMSEAQFNQCISDEKALTELNKRMESAIKQQKISATPTFVINGKTVKEGEMSLAELDAAIAAASKK